MIAFVPIIFGVVGVLVYALSANPKLQELGRITFAASAFALMFALAQRTITLFPK
jgi:uncharacterized membrane protein